MEFNQAFKAPTIPKLSKTTIKSPVIRGAIKPPVAPRLNRSIFSFRPKSVAESISKKTDQESTTNQAESISKKINQESAINQSVIVDSLIQTNKILVDIQKQLALDFSSRIAEEQEQIKAFKKEKEKRQRISKEKSIETVGKIGKKITDTFSFITKPVKSIFDTIFEFLSIIFTGIVVNNAFNWLSKKENREKVSKFFDFLIDNWKIFAGILVGGVALRALYKIIRLVQGIKSILRFLRILPKKGGGAPGGGEKSISRGGLLRTGEGGRRGISTERTGLLRQTYDRYDPNSRPGSGMQEIYKRTKSPVGKALQGIDVGFKKAGSDIMKAIGMGPGAKGIFKFLRPIFKRIPFIGGLIDFAVSLALGENPGRAAAKAAGAILGGALGSFPPLVPFGGPIWGAIVGDLIAGGVYDALTKGKTAEEGEKAEDVPKMELGGKIKGPSHAAGGVFLNAEGGEYIVKKKQVPRYEPVLKDINENGGRLWEEFIAGVKRQKTINDISFATTLEFEELLDKYKEIVEEDEKRLKEKQSKKIGGSYSSPPPAPTLPSPSSTPTEPSPAPESSSTPTPSTPSTPSSGMNLPGPISPQSNAILDNLFGRAPGTTATMQSGIQPGNTGPDVARIASLTPSPPKPRSLSPIEEGKIEFTTLPPIMNGSTEAPPLPSYNKGQQEYPSILPYDPSNEYLERAIFEYDIEGVSFGGR